MGAREVAILRWILCILALLAAAALAFLSLALKPPVFLGLVASLGALIFAVLIAPPGGRRFGFDGKAGRLVATLALLVVVSFAALVGGIGLRSKAMAKKAQLAAAAAQEKEELGAFADIWTLKDKVLTQVSSGTVTSYRASEDLEGYRSYLPLIHKLADMQRAKDSKVLGCASASAKMLEQHLYAQAKYGSTPEADSFTRGLTYLDPASGPTGGVYPILPEEKIRLITALWHAADMETGLGVEDYNRDSFASKIADDVSVMIGQGRVITDSLMVFDQPCSASITEDDAMAPTTFQ